MKIAIIGYGKMGRMIEKCALDRGHEIVACMNSKEWDMQALQQAEACIEFSQPDAVVENIQRLVKLKKQIVIGTTGWYDQLEAVRSLVEKAQIGVVYSPNFSIGIHLLLSILAHTSSLMNGFEEYDAASIEIHHTQKKDSPSGTALEIAKTVEENLKRLEVLPISSVRCGSTPGTHTVLFDSACDTLSITHTARNREGFAKGAVQASEWLQGRKGLYTFAECMQSFIQGKVS